MPVFTLHARRLAQCRFNRLARWQAFVPQAFGDPGVGRQVTLHAFVEQRLFGAERRVKTRCGDAATQAGLELGEGGGVVAVLPEQVQGLVHSAFAVEGTGAAHLCHVKSPVASDIDTSRYISR
ncbi:hypothetical protein PFLUOLIPICF7_17330 [Pseudomonas simiae]|nr:hypothetical protein PFLUOLIPICF7_17330 [Pseudomonas simiae]